VDAAGDPRDDRVIDLDALLALPALSGAYLANALAVQRAARALAKTVALYVPSGPQQTLAIHACQLALCHATSGLMLAQAAVEADPPMVVIPGGH
jgi:hypothetical protein